MPVVRASRGRWSRRTRPRCATRASAPARSTATWSSPAGSSNRAEAVFGASPTTRPPPSRSRGCASPATARGAHQLPHAGGGARAGPRHAGRAGRGHVPDGCHDRAAPGRAVGPDLERGGLRRQRCSRAAPATTRLPRRSGTPKSRKVRGGAHGARRGHRAGHYSATASGSPATDDLVFPDWTGGPPVPHGTAQPLLRGAQRGGAASASGFTTCVTRSARWRAGAGRPLHQHPGVDGPRPHQHHDGLRALHPRQGRCSELLGKAFRAEPVADARAAAL